MVAGQDSGDELLYVVVSDCATCNASSNSSFGGGGGGGGGGGMGL